ncbi:MAG: hypothetical protein IJT06_02115 [Selenomonadaceae bacterium]|nr:hypothetical protein [Selenomonadaceae bacterium]
MLHVLKRAAVVFVAAVMLSIFGGHDNAAEAKANITWTTTDVVLEFKKCIVKGYFTNTGDTGGYVTKMDFTVDVRTATDGEKNIYSATWTYSPEDCYIPAGSQENWSFWLNDESCPRWTGDKHWSIRFTIHNK